MDTVLPCVSTYDISSDLASAIAVDRVPSGLVTLISFCKFVTSDAVAVTVPSRALYSVRDTSCDCALDTAVICAPRSLSCAVRPVSRSTIFSASITSLSLSAFMRSVRESSAPPIASVICSGVRVIPSLINWLRESDRFVTSPTTTLRPSELTSILELSAEIADVFISIRSFVAESLNNMSFSTLSMTPAKEVIPSLLASMREMIVEFALAIADARRSESIPPRTILSS